MYTFISDFNNFKVLLPPQVSNWGSTTDTCTFMIEGMPQLTLRIIEKVTDSLVVITPDSTSPIPFELRCIMKPAGEHTCFVEVQVNAELNPFMAMMVARPLENFVKMIGDRLRMF
jgi:hypothetical protein